MIEIRRANLDEGVLGELVAVLGTEATDQLLQAFDQEIRSRPVIIADQIATGDFCAARRSAHHLKGAALVVGAGEVASIAEQIELAHSSQMAAQANYLLSLGIKAIERPIVMQVPIQNDSVWDGEP